jgi:hypothetical protein
MPDLPSGTVTFLFTDIEGSTQLLHALRVTFACMSALHMSYLADGSVYQPSTRTGRNLRGIGRTRD